ncbi:PAS domain-containing sensor histidine kinase [Archangium lansingense]|uniref:histidine kinase n=1 Tax=Archangium lansingense TaxID=2995310 RepID=A0ABT4AEZ2_9BACT|nr:PAS domain-containing sensor histidine kinase [Archangium lansinium]MCY1080248.1 PAS domain-containing sensor histidine kinase [Archangium lansinium]
MKLDWKRARKEPAPLEMLEELTAAALDIVDQASADRFMEQLALWLGCAVALLLDSDSGGQVHLWSAAGLSSNSRGLAISTPLAHSSWSTLALPYPELASPELVRSCIPLGESEGSAEQSQALLLFSERALWLPLRYHGMVRCLARGLHTALGRRQRSGLFLGSEFSLPQEKALLQSLNEASRDGIALFACEGQLIFANHRFSEMWGLDEELRSGSRDLLVTAAAAKVMDPAGFVARAQYYLDHPEVVGSDDIAMRDGRVFYRYTAPIRSADGACWGRGYYFRDVTSRRQSERALRLERDFNSAILDTLDALVVVLDRRGRIIRFNRACQRATGYSFEEVLDVTFWEQLLLPQDLELLKAEFVRLIESKQPRQLENSWMARDGKRRRIAWSNTVLLGEDGEVEYVIGTGIDVTEQRQAEAERDRLLAWEQEARARAEEQERRLAFLSGASGLLAGSLDEDSTLRGVAHLAVPRFADWCIIDLLDPDQSVRRILVEHADPTQAERARILRAHVPSLGATLGPGKVLRTGEAELLPEAALVPAGLEFRSCLCVPLLARDRILGVLTFGLMAPRRPYGTVELSLAQELARRTALAVDNARLYLAARQAIDLRDEFLSIASHELKTPLTTMKLALQGALRANRAAPQVETSPLSMPRSLETIEKHCGRLTRLVESLLEVSRLQAGHLELDLEEMDLSSLVREVAARFATELEKARCELTLRADAPVLGHWDVSRVDQILTHLFSNAIKYGSGKPVEVEVGRIGGLARLVVRDHGIGIPRERQGQIFRPFERAVSSRYYGGLGLGLHIVHQLVERLGGTIRVESEPGAGSTFIVQLPCAVS